MPRSRAGRQDSGVPMTVVDSPIVAAARDSWDVSRGAALLPGLVAHARLGGGHRCESWLSWSTRDLCFVTVKLPRPGQVANPLARAAIAREEMALRSLRHPAVPRLLHADAGAPVPHLVTEYVEGPTLAAALRDDGPFEPDDVVLLGIQLAIALHYLHTVPLLVHLDVKPGNVVLRDGRPVLLDFGTARPVGAPAPTGKARGTPAYMGPEQRRRRPAAPGMDVFALGVMLDEVLHGSRREPACAPCDDTPLDATLAQLRHEDAPGRPPTALAVARRLDRHVQLDDERPVPTYAWSTVRRR